MKPNYKDRSYDEELGYAYTLQVPHTEPMYRVDNSKYKDTFTVVGDEQLNYYLHERGGYKNRSYDGLTGYIYPASFE